MEYSEFKQNKLATMRHLPQDDTVYAGFCFFDFCIELSDRITRLSCSVLTIVRRLYATPPTALKDCCNMNHDIVTLFPSPQGK